MNMDIAAAGFVSKIVAIDVVNINGNNIPKEKYLKAVNADVAEMLELYSRNGFGISEKRVKKLRFFGGETADLVDQTPSCILDAAFFSRMPREDVVKGNVQVDDVIFAISSAGKAVWEKEFNYGHMSNGSTHSRSGFFHPDYEGQFPFLVSKHNPLKGPFRVDEYISELGTTAGKALTSPCRHVGLIIKLVLDKLKLMGGFDLLHGITLVTGGGLKKIINLGKGIRYELKLESEMITPLFRVIQDVTKESWKNMFKSYNNGICLQFIGSAERGILQEAIISVANEINVACYWMGNCSASRHETGKNEVIITDPWGDEHYYDK
jgi:phosphoribosylformylglycinamidine cyclo-ligase